MQVDFLRSGGFAGPATRRSFSINSKELSADDAEELQKLISDSNFAELARQRAPSQPHPDAFSYRITVDDGNNHYTVRASDAEMPPSLQPLIDWLMLRASSGS